jgi:hypothetical protein
MEHSINSFLSWVIKVGLTLAVLLNVLYIGLLNNQVWRARQTITKLTVVANRADDLAKHTLKLELENKRLKAESEACQAVLKNFGKLIRR